MRNTKRKGLLGMLAAGAIALSGAVCALRDRPLVDGIEKQKEDDCGLALYVETPSYPEAVQKGIDYYFYNIAKLDGTKEHPEKGRVGFYEGVYPEGIRKGRETSLLKDKFLYEQELAFLIHEDKIGEEIYRFSDLRIIGFENRPWLLEKIKEKYPWFIEASETGGYLLKIERDSNKKARKLIYELANGKIVIVEDRNGDYKADYIEEK